MRTVVSKDGTKIAYDVSGQGPVLIYITGAICFRNMQPVRKDVKVFSKDFTVYSYDRRGRGDSGDTLPYSIDREVEDIEALINAAGGSAILLGHSSGGVLALEAALKLPNKVSKAIAYDTANAGSEKEAYEYVAATAQVRNHLANQENGKAVKSFLTIIGMPKIFTFLIPMMPGWGTIKALAPTLMYDIELTKNVTASDRLKNIKVPTYIFYGEKSPASMSAVAKQTAAAISHSKLKGVPSQDHMVNPNVMLSLLKECL